MNEEYIERIITSPLFLKLKNVVENNSFHNHETVFIHLIKTKDIAKRELTGDFIINPEAKKLFLRFINEDFHGMKRADIMVLIALLHDIGKILKVRQGNNTETIMVTDSSGITSVPGHEYWGSTIVEIMLKDLNMKPEIITYIANVVRLHDSFGGPYWASKKDWPLELTLNDVKSRAEGFYKETLFNIYCDCFNAEPFEPDKKMIIKVFNEPKLYLEREYVIT